jgi:NAD(P)-dependent dehydrogenase (short-subunit alcohol dehydrogenase family)
VKSNDYLNNLNNILVRWEAVDAGVDEALLLDARGLVTEGSGDNVFVLRGRRLMTPPVLNIQGTTRETILALASRADLAADVGELTPCDLYTADEVFLTSTVVGVLRSSNWMASRSGRVGPIPWRASFRPCTRTWSWPRGRRSAADSAPGSKIPSSGCLGGDGETEDRMELRLRGKVAVVSGASKGIGRAVALGLADEGVQLALNARGTALLEQVAGEIMRRYDVTALSVPGDMSRLEDVHGLVSRTIERFGRVDILVNSAGSSQGGIFWEVPDQVWLDSWGLKLFGYVRLMREVIPHMMRQGGGRIVNIVGNTGKQPIQTMLPGASANAALLAINKGAADALARYNIVVNAVNPGPIRTERWDGLMERLGRELGLSGDEYEKTFLRDIPAGRIGRPEEIADLVVFLASERAAYLTGISITADGGMTRAMA